ncbi:5'-3' exonuclease, N-terminal resolvase-like domain protein [Thermocrinis albus DSM 14484]|uniref:5'-3' exonuclease, N-terminal resolvase-like domain protein n=1 Tax=Thermocrinis albus (strain DSM 14484 / JCM 11386 / HI 11/12) TaxID=638303 RepID=D3SLF7_THEAH|nr:5'-3' exonuclease H3TH domain-containing protein [Thermocrinis albus]ADC89587.1 5'-3' exonuclease, N-terminal resolvase-like domain protein [Thermocrinis albus DSM 14484]
MKVLYLLDGSAFLYRSFFALPPLSTKDGFPTGAVYGFLRALLSIIKSEKPQYMAVVFDHPSPTVRKKEYAHYKTNRPTMPDPLKVQIPVIKELTVLLGIPLVEMEGYEADDIIAALTHRALEEGFKVRIYSPDKDILQLVKNEQVVVINPIKGEVLDERKVMEKFGVPPEKLADYLALVGDKVDNVEGVKGVGPKTALKVLEAYGSVENILSQWDSFIKAFPHASKENLERSYWLVKLHPPEEMSVDIQTLRIKDPRMDELRQMLQKLEIKSVLKDLEELYGTKKQRTLF